MIPPFSQKNNQQTGLRLTPEEVEQYLSVAVPVDEFVAGASALAERMKSRALKEIVAARQTMPKDPPKEEEQHGQA